MTGKDLASTANSGGWSNGPFRRTRWESAPAGVPRASFAATRAVGVPVRIALLVLVVGLACLLPGWSAEATGHSEAFRAAIRADDLGALARVLETAGSVAVTNSVGDTPLHMAAHVGTPGAVSWLIEHGANVNTPNASGATPLHRGAGDPRIVAMLLARGARADLPTHHGHTPVMLAARIPGATESVRLLLERGVDVNARSRFGATALMAAVAASNPTTTRWLLEKGADPKALPLPADPKVDPLWGGMRTPLMWAAFRRDRSMADLLIEHGAEANQVGPTGTALAQAAWADDEAMARHLVARGADVRTPEPFTGFSPLHWAASSESGGPGLVRFLLEKGANPLEEGGQHVDAFLGEPRTPRDLARMRGESAITRALGETHPAPGDAEDRPGAARSRRGHGPAEVPAAAWAMASSVPPLQKTAWYSKEAFLRHGSKQDCVSCHQQYFPLMAVALAGRQGVPIDTGEQRRLERMILDQHRYSSLELETLFHPDPAHSLGYALLSLRLAGVSDSGVTDGLAQHLAAIQHLDGHWNVNFPRPPLESSDIAATALGVHALKRFGWTAREREFQERIERARTWLERAIPVTVEERAYQLLGLRWAGVPAEDLKSRAEKLVALQRANGGWAQQPGLAPDAYATGQVLYALLEATPIEATDEIVRRGAAFLVESQASDGTWHVKRRAFPFQPTMESGFPYGRDAWISATGTSWAVLALARSGAKVDSSRLAAVTSLLASRSKGASGAKTLSETSDRSGEVDFERDVRRVLERSCVPCHSGEKPRGGYAMTDRESVLSAGASGIHPVLPGRASESPVVKYIAGEVEEFVMPPAAKRDRFPALTPRELAALKAWIAEGAAWPGGVVLGSRQPAAQTN